MGCGECWGMVSVMEREEEIAGVVGQAPVVKERLTEFMADVAGGLVRSEQRRCAALYARGLLEAGARKSLEPIVERLGEDGESANPIVARNLLAGKYAAGQQSGSRPFPADQRPDPPGAVLALHEDLTLGRHPGA